MKRFFLTIFSVAILASCKEPAAETPTPPAPETPTVTTAEEKLPETIPTYFGLGGFDYKGDAEYYVSLPKHVHEATLANVSYMRVNDMVFIQLNIPHTARLNNPNNDILKLSFKVPGFKGSDTSLQVRTWHDSVSVLTTTQAATIIQDHCPDKDAPVVPKSCGNGVLTRI